MPPQPNLTDATIEYLFAPQEVIAAKQLDPLKIMWIQTKYAQLWKARNSQTPPLDPKDYELYFRAIAELDGKMMQLQEFLDEHMEVTKVVNEAKAVRAESEKREAEDLAKRASKQVDKPNSTQG